MSPDQTTDSQLTDRQRWTQLAVLVLAGGAIYPVLYLRQNFELSLLEALGISSRDLSECYSLLGAAFVLCYVPSGWLADRFRPRHLLSLSMVLTGVLALWFATLPPLLFVKLIFCGWGISTGLTFWGALIKGVALLAADHRQGTFFGVLEGGRGAVEALLATIGLALFAWMLNQSPDDTAGAMQATILFYAGACLGSAPLVYLFIRVPHAAPRSSSGTPVTALIRDLKALGGNPSLWMAGLCVLAGYQLFWATYSFSGLLQGIYGLSAVTAGSITVAKLWMRPIGAIVTGLLGDRINPVRMLAVLMLTSAVGLVMLPLLPSEIAVPTLVVTVMAVGLLTYGIRGIYWATLEDCHVADSRKGLAIGVISLVGYAPDFYLPLLKAYCLEQWSGAGGYAAYYGVLSLGGVLGSLAAWQLHRRAVSGLA